MRKFIDLRLVPRPRLGESMVRRAHELGYSGVALTGEKIRDATVIEVYPRIDLEPSSQQQLKQQLGTLRKNYTVVSVTCNTKNIARDAARDTRVDIIRFPTDNRRKTVWMDRQQATLAAEYGCHYEIETAELLAQDPAVLSETLRILRRELKNANKNDVPIILSSGAPDIYGLRAPRDMASLMELLDVDEVEALDMVSANPWAIVEGNRDKLSGRSVLPGVSRVE